PITMFAPGTTIPGVMIGFNDGALIDATVGGGDTVTGLVGPSISISLDNRIAGFSSRGPNGGAPDIIKPDVAAPGVGILAAETLDPNRVNGGGQPFQFLSGTSMSSPHAAGAFALLKQAHPGWTAAQARSALMTTARQNLQKTFGGDPADPFDIGAGHIVPGKAFDPGLTYDAGFLDYVAFLCGAELQPQIVSPGFCALLESFGFSLDSSDLNLPSIGVAELVGTQTVPRTVTSVTGVTATYNVSVDAPPGIDVVVSPASLTLDPGETATYEVTFTATPAAALEQWAFGSLTWGHGPHAVRSPIAVRPFPFAAPAQVGGSGTDGTLSFDIQFGYAGDYTAGTHGLVPADEQAGNVVDDPANDINTALGTGVGVTFHFVNVPAGTDVARFALFDEDTDGNDDLDLYVFGPDSAGFPFVGGSGSPTSAEQVDLLFPAPGVYIAVVHGWQTDGPDANYQLSSWAFGPDVGNMTVTAPGAAAIGPAGVTVDWSGLGAGTRYLGAVSHSDGGGLIGLTTILIDTR
ncbi:MAG TPA: S8 family serine peptidase, partial [Gemmatimonadota bacterium]|nr:S8 family serine peptidase [Gemmatimonadota bacterium]